MRQSLSPDRNTRLTYSEGTLETTKSLEIHEFSAWLIGRYEFLATARVSEMRADRELREWLRSLAE